jgi:GxxExxY protein
MQRINCRAPNALQYKYFLHLVVHLFQYVIGNLKDMNENELSRIIIGMAIDVHRSLGPGLLESVYKECLFYELKKAGFLCVKEKPVPLIYEGIILDCGYRIDILVEDKVVVEIKSVDQIAKVHLAQILTYLRIGHYKLGLLINFKMILLKDGIRRVVNDL